MSVAYDIVCPTDDRAAWPAARMTSIGASEILSPATGKSRRTTATRRSEETR